MISNEDLEAHAASMMEQPWWSFVEAEIEQARQEIMANDPQTYRIVIEVEFTGTWHQAEEEAYHIVRSLGEDRAEYVALYDEDAYQV